MKHVCSVATVAGLLLAGAAHAQSLADVAKKEQERRKAIDTPAKVYTEADIQKSAPLTTAAARPAPAAEGADAGATEAGAVKAGDSKDAAGGQAPKDEAAWRASLGQARDDLARSRRLLTAMEQQAVGLGIQAASAAATGQPGPDQARQQETAREIERLRAEVQKNADAVSKIEGDARASGVPPGWVR